MKPSFSTVILTILLGSCGGEVPEEASGVEGLLRYPDPETVDSIVVDLEIGMASGPAEEMFGVVRDLEVNSEGEIFVLDSSINTVRVYSPTGEFLRSLGGRGEGPAEFRGPTQITVGSDGSVWVYDDFTRTVVAMTDDGRETARYPTRSSGPTGGPLSFTWDGRIGHDGRLVQTIQHYDLPPANEMGVFELESRLFVRWLDPEAGTTDSIQFASDPLRRFRQNSPGPGGAMGTTQGVVSFDARRLAALDGDGNIWLALSTTYELTRVTPQGDTLVVQLDVPDRPAGPEELSAWERFEDEGVAQPTRGHLIWRMFTDDENRLWVQRAAGYEVSDRFDVFGQNGDLVGAVVLPGVHERYATLVRAGHLYSVSYDELSVPRVIRAPLPEFR